MTDQNPPPVQYDPIFFPPGPQIGDVHDATNGLRYVWDGQVWKAIRLDPDLFVLKAGDALTGALRWNNPPPSGVAIDITQGSIQVHGGGVRVEAPGEILSPIFVAEGDPAGYAFGTPTEQNGGIYKKRQEGVVIREDRDGHRLQVESSDGANLWEVMDARGGTIRRQGANRALNFTDDDSAENFAAIYQDGAGNFVLRKGNPGFAQATCVRTRPGDPARLEIVGAPEQDLDAVNKAYVDAIAGDYVLKAGDDVEGTLRWTDPPGAGVAIGITRGNVEINAGDIRVDGGRIAANLFDVWQDGSGYFFQRGISGEHEGGLLKHVGRGLALRQSSGNQRPVIETNDGSEQWEIVDARGGTFHRDGSANVGGPPLVWVDDGAVPELARIYGSRATNSDSLGAFIVQVYDGQTWQTALRTRQNVGDLPRVELVAEPVNPLDATNKVYVDQAIAGVGGVADDRVLRAGDTMEGPLRTAIDPVADEDMVNKAYVDEVADDVRVDLDGRILRAGDTMEGPLRTAIAPVADEDLVNKVYVDRLVTAVPAIIGAIDASTGQCRLTTGPGPVPDPAAVPVGSYLICEIAGTIPSGPAAGIAMNVGDWLINGGVFWHELAVGNPGVATTADQVALIPPVFGANVQAAMEAVEAEFSAVDAGLDARVSKAGDVMTGPLTLAGPPTADNHATTRAYVDSHLVKTWATGASYAANDFVRYDNLLFEVVTPIPSAPALPDFTTIRWLAGSQSDYWAGTRDNANALWLNNAWVHIATIPAYGSFRLQLECFGSSIDCSFVFEIGTTFGAGTFTIVSQTKNAAGTLWRQFRLSAQGGGANLVRFEGQLGSATAPNFKIAISGLRVDQGPAAQRVALVKPLIASAANLGGTQYLLMEAYGNGSVQAPRFDVFEAGGRFHCHHPNAGDANDGDIGARIFARGLNIIGCRTEATDATGVAGRSIRTWGDLEFTSGAGTGPANILTDLVVSKNSAVVDLRTVAATGQFCGVWFREIANARWHIGKGNGAAAEFRLISYNDNGGEIGHVFDVNRTTRVLNFLVGPTVNGTPLLDTTAGDARYLRQIGGVLSGDLSINNNALKAIRFNRANAANSFWITTGTANDDRLNIGCRTDASVFFDVLNIARATGVTDFARRPTVAGVPILAESDGDARYIAARRSNAARAADCNARSQAGAA